MGRRGGFLRWIRIASPRSLQPGLVDLRAVGGVGPTIGGGVVGGDDLAQHRAVVPSRAGHGPAADEAEGAIDGDMRLVAKGRDCQLWH